MIIVASLSHQARNLIRIRRCGYHVEDLLKRPVRDRKLLIYGPANALYLDSINKTPFSERKLMRVALEQSKIEGMQENYNKIFKCAIKNLKYIQEFKTIPFLLQILYEIKSDNKEYVRAIATRGFQILKQQQKCDQEKSYSFSLTRMLIAISRLIELKQFKDEHFNLILIEKMKPLFLTYILQLFWETNLHDQYQLPKKIIELLSTNRDLIPFSDVHHMIMAKKIIKDPIFHQIANEMQFKLKQNVSSANSTDRIDPEVVSIMYEEYLNDLKAKYL